MEKIRHQLRLRSELINKLEKDELFQEQIFDAYFILKTAVRKNKKILVCGNGGSAADAQHFAAELVCRFLKQRRALPVMALTTNSSILTAQSNDSGFDSVFSRQVEALAEKGDVLIVITTSDVSKDGHSANIKKALDAAAIKGAHTIGFFSSKTKKLLKMVEAAIVAPSHVTDLIQEVHEKSFHILCHLIEGDLSASD